jgi:hypothetical protein
MMLHSLFDESMQRLDPIAACRRDANVREACH